MQNESESSDYGIEPAAEDGSDRTARPVAAPVSDEKRCVGCGYVLRGLARGGLCPECGTDIGRSLSGNLLVMSSAEYLAKLHRGVFLIVVAIAVQCVLVIGGIGIGIAGAITGASWLDGFSVGLMAVSTVVDFVALYGWWLFSAPDPAVIEGETGDRPRIVVRVALVIGAVWAVINMYIELAGLNLDNGVSHVAVAGTVVVITGLAGIAKFFASMLYIKWLAPRLPNDHVRERAGKLMWLGPLLMTVGWLILIGPLIALVLYWNLLNWVRRDLSGIAKQNAARFG